MSKAVSLIIETQTEDREVISICHLNEKMIALEVSFVANKMLKLNRALFDKINQTTKLIGGALYRQEVVEVNHGLNNAYVNIGNSFEFNETDIAKLFFEDNVLKKQQRAISKYGKKFDFDPNLISSENAGGYFDIKKLSPDDIAASTIVSTVEEITLFQDELGIKSFLITDSLQKKKSLLKVGYRIEFIVEANFNEYVMYVIKQAEDSIKFLTGYLNSLDYSNNYNNNLLQFNPDYTSQVMTLLGLSPNLISADLASRRVKSSDFGQAAIAYYNLAALLSKDVDKSAYLSVMKTILPTNKTTPDSIGSFIRNYSSLLKSVKFEYLNDSTRIGIGRKYSRVSKGQVNTNIVEAISKEALEIEQESLGYLIFSNNPGLNLFSSEDYKKRWALEQAKYYPNIKASDASSFMTSNEKLKFADTSNATSYLTPLGLIMGDKIIKTTRGINNVSVDEVLAFRLAKSIRQSQQHSTSYPQSVEKNSISIDSLSSLNVTIAPPKDALINRSIEQKIDPLIDSSLYVGNSSTFSTNNPLELIKGFNRILTSEEKRILFIASTIVPNSFLKNNKAIKSIQEIQFSNPNSIVRNLVVNQELVIEDIPPHVKYMMSTEFNPNPNSDPLQNIESGPIIEETQTNLFVIHALVGFGPVVIDETNFVNVHSPRYERMSSNILSSGRPILGKALDYEIPSLGIVKDNFLATIYNNLIYIRG